MTIRNYFTIRCQKMLNYRNVISNLYTILNVALTSYQWQRSYFSIIFCMETREISLKCCKFKNKADIFKRHFKYFFRVASEGLPDLICGRLPENPSPLHGLQGLK
jgi:hypothetical protein